MIIVLTGASGSGKTTIENELSTHYGYQKIIPYTTRKPRPGEQNGRDYYFISNNEFEEMNKLGLFATCEEYSQERKYATLKSDYIEGERVVVLTPNGLRQLNRYMKMANLFIVYIQANLGTRIKRYINRIGDIFSYDDKNEICSRVERDYAMFFGMENDADLVLDNNDDANIKDLVSEIINA